MHAHHALLAAFLSFAAGMSSATGSPAAPDGASGPDGAIAWDKDWDAAFARAAAERKVVFLAVNMDGERANDTLAAKTYRDERVVDLAARTVNLLASRFEHGGKSCARFEGLSCAEHQRVDVTARAQVLKAGLDGQVVAPQHVWLDGSGKVLLSVAYQVGAEELVWCFVTALRRVDPEGAPAMPGWARAPRRAVVDGVAGDETVRPLTEKELEETLDALNKAGLGRDRGALVASLLATDHPDAIEAVAKELSGANVRGGGRGTDALEGLQTLRRALVHRVGIISPPSFWEAIVDGLEEDDPRMRIEAAVALEQLGAEEALKAVRKALGAEKDPRAMQDLVRALGACGRADGSARKRLLQLAKDKDAGLRRNALFALGMHASEKEAAAVLEAAFTAPDGADAQAALLGLAAAAAEQDWVERIGKAALAKGVAAETAALAKRAVAVLKGEAPLAGLGEDVVRVCGDTVRRERFFPAQPAGAPVGGAGGGAADGGSGSAGAR